MILLLYINVYAVPVRAQQGIRIIFLHHSCGENLINQGDVRKGLSELGYLFFDHGYNDDGLCLADGRCPGTNYRVPGDNTDPDGIAKIFRQPLQIEPGNTFSYLMQYDVIMFKSCYPVSNIGSDEELDILKEYYLTIRERIDQYPQKHFIIVTQPPQVPRNSSSDEAQRARALADWLKSERFLDGHPNLSTFDFFDTLAGEDNFLRKEYRVNNSDGHPNERANREIGPIFVRFIDTSIREYASDTPQHLENPPTDTPETPEPIIEEPAKGKRQLPCPGVLLPLTLVIIINLTRKYYRNE
jgi:hypothetical protein